MNCTHDWQDRQLRFDCSTPRTYHHSRYCKLCQTLEELPLTPAQQKLQDEEWYAVRKAYGLER